MKGNEFVDALRDAVAPAAVVNIAGGSEGLEFKLSDGRLIKAERKAIAALNDGDELAAYVKRVIG
jgi:hypothetical protein